MKSNDKVAKMILRIQKMNKDMFFNNRTYKYIQQMSLRNKGEL